MTNEGRDSARLLDGFAEAEEAAVTEVAAPREKADASEQKIHQPAVGPANVGFMAPGTCDCHGQTSPENLRLASEGYKTPVGVYAIETRRFEGFFFDRPFGFALCYSGDRLGAGEMITMMLQPRGNRNPLYEFQVDFRRAVFHETCGRPDGFGTGFERSMTKFELIHLLVAQARANGFEFRKWYIAKLKLPWETTQKAIETLCAERRYYALLFSHEFASSFWKAGERITFQVPTQTFTRRMADGTIATVSRKGYTRRSARDDAWRYHLRELAVAEEPLRYMRRYLRVEDELDWDEELDVPLERGESPAPVAEEAPQRQGLSIVPMRVK